MTNPDPLLGLLQRLQQKCVEYVLVGRQAVHLHGFFRARQFHW